MWCAVKDGIAYEGDTKGIVSHLYTLRFELNFKGGSVFAKLKGYEEESFAYNDEWMHEELLKDVFSVLLRRLHRYGFRIYKLDPWLN